MPVIWRACTPTCIPYRRRPFPAACRPPPRATVGRSIEEEGAMSLGYLDFLIIALFFVLIV